MAETIVTKSIVLLIILNVAFPDYIYFKRVFDRVSLNDPTPRSGSQVVDNN